ncbi:MAG TPA: PAS domain-containing protein [Flavisolibacter sp.]|nr:PAS domain-containing protein [Flavisolibacter sp.]
MQSFSDLTGLSLEEMQRHPSIIINAFDHEHKVLFWNDTCARHFGIPTEKAIGKKLEEILPWTKTDEKLLYIDRALMGKPMQVMKVPYRMKKGYYEQRVYPVKDSNGKVIAALNLVEEMS